jgi:transcriptional regulator with XRE-family HTH domain
MTLLRRVLGETLRGVRLRQRRTLREVSGAARVSLGYLSEVERGQKEASSELLAAICDALDVRLSELLREVTETMQRSERATEVAGVPARQLVGAGARVQAGGGVPAGEPRVRIPASGIRANGLRVRPERPDAVEHRPDGEQAIPETVPDTTPDDMPVDSATGAVPVEAGPAGVASVDAGPVEAGPVEAEPAGAAPSDAGPVDAGAVDADTPVDTIASAVPAASTARRDMVVATLPVDIAAPVGGGDGAAAPLDRPVRPRLEGPEVEGAGLPQDLDGVAGVGWVGDTLDDALTDLAGESGPAHSACCRFAGAAA